MENLKPTTVSSADRYAEINGRVERDLRCVVRRVNKKLHVVTAQRRLLDFNRGRSTLYEVVKTLELYAAVQVATVRKSNIGSNVEVSSRVYGPVSQLAAGSRLKIYSVWIRVPPGLRSQMLAPSRGASVFTDLANINN